MAPSRLHRRVGSLDGIDHGRPAGFRCRLRTDEPNPQVVDRMIDSLHQRFPLISAVVDGGRAGAHDVVSDQHSGDSAGTGGTGTT